jgi:hypothetical protein
MLDTDSVCDICGNPARYTGRLPIVCHECRGLVDRGVFTRKELDTLGLQRRATLAGITEGEYQAAIANS